MTREELAGKIEGQIQQTGYAQVSASDLWDALNNPQDVTPQIIHLFATDYGWNVRSSDINNISFVFFPFGSKPDFKQES